MRRRIDTTTRTDMRRSGVTLIDLTITVLIMGILAAATAPRFAGVLADVRVDTAAERVIADLALARRHAIATSQLTKVDFRVEADGYFIPTIRHTHSQSEIYQVKLSDPPYEVNLVEVQFANGAVLSFDQYGQIGRDGKVLLSASGRQRMIVIDAETGRAHLQ